MVITGIELLVFESSDTSVRELAEDLPSIKEAHEAGLRISVHLPGDFSDASLRIVGMLADLAGIFVFHPAPEGAKAAMTLWFSRAAEVLADARKRARPGSAPGEVHDSHASLAAVESGRLCLEYTTEADFRSSLDALVRAGHEPSICMDTGHLLLEGRDPAEFVHEFGPRLGHVHLHGIAPRSRLPGEYPGMRLSDHAALETGQNWLGKTLSALSDYRGIVELEVFGEDLLHRSIDTLGKLGFVPAPEIQ